MQKSSPDVTFLLLQFCSQKHVLPITETLAGGLAKLLAHVLTNMNLYQTHVNPRTN